MSDSLKPHGLYRLNSGLNSPGQNTALGSLSLLQGILPTQKLNPDLLHCRQVLYQLTHHLPNSYFNFLLPPPYMVLRETVKRSIWREARKVFLGTPRQATGKPRVTGLPAWLRTILHSPGTPLAQSTNPLFSFALESDVKVTIHCSFIKNISNMTENISFYHHTANPR